MFILLQWQPYHLQISSIVIAAVYLQEQYSSITDQQTSHLSRFVIIDSEFNPENLKPVCWNLTNMSTFPFPVCTSSICAEMKIKFNLLKLAVNRWTHQNLPVWALLVHWSVGFGVSGLDGELSCGDNMTNLAAAEKERAEERKNS